RTLYVVAGRLRHPCDDVAGGGIADVEHLARARLDLASVDKIAVQLDVDRSVFRNVQACLPSTITALRFSAGSTRFSVCMMCALMIRTAPRLSRRCIASIKATCSATSCAGSWPLTLATLTRTSRSAWPIRSHSAAAMRRLPEACASAEWKARL